jgi:uncharacterized RDD family membrane protein YckC
MNRMQDTDPLEYVGFWPRVAASLIDTLALLLVCVPLLWIFGGVSALFDPSMSSSPASLFVNWVLPFVLTAFFWRYFQATPGKMAIGALIVDAKTGEAPSNSQVLIRYVGYIISTIALGLGFIWIGFDARKQGWHDKLAGTVVVRSRHRVQPVRFDGQKASVRRDPR